MCGLLVKFRVSGCCDVGFGCSGVWGVGAMGECYGWSGCHEWDVGAVGGVGAMGRWVQVCAGCRHPGVPLRARVTPVTPPAEFSIWTREAGAGGLSIAVEGPSKAEISFEDRKDGSCGVSYLVQEPGERGLHPNSPNPPTTPNIPQGARPGVGATGPSCEEGPTCKGVPSEGCPQVRVSP